jgi:hypothetical protein
VNFLRVNLLGSAALAAAVSLPLALPILAQSQNTQQQQSPQPDNGQTATTFTGQIAKSQNGKYVLQDPTKSSALSLDDQKLAKKYAGKNVVVTGTLDAANNVIHVQKIEESV